MHFLTIVELFIHGVNQPLSDVEVALYDRDRRSEDDLLGVAVTDQDGQARFQFSTRDFADRFGVFDDEAFIFPHFDTAQFPDLYVVVYDRNNEVVLSTRERVRENTVPITLRVRVSREHAQQHGLVGPTSWSNVANWFTDRGNSPHTASINDALTLPLTKRWQTQLGGTIIASAAGGHGHVYIGSGDKKLHALDPNNGSIVWTTALGGEVSSTVTAIEERDGSGVVFVTAEDGTLYSLNPSNGSQNWSLTGGVGRFISSTNYSAGRVYHTYMSTGVSSRLRAVNVQNGQMVWESDDFNITTSTPMHGDGGVYLGIAQIGQIYMRFDDGTGTLDWVCSNNHGSATSYTSGVLDKEDVGIGAPRVYISTQSGCVRALDAATGAQIWETPLPVTQPVYGFALTQSRPENILIVSQLANLYALDPKTGTIQWHYSHPTNGVSSVNRRTPQPAIWGDYVIQVTDRNKLVAMNLANRTVGWTYDLDVETFASPMVAGGTVYIGTTSGSMYAFSPGRCVDFHAFPDNTQFNQPLPIDGFLFTGLDTSTPFFVNDADTNVHGLQFAPAGVQIDLPELASGITLQVGSYNDTLSIAALDRSGDVADSHVIRADNTVHTVELTGQGITSVVIMGGGFEGILVEICMTAQ